MTIIKITLREILEGIRTHFPENTLDELNKSISLGEEAIFAKEAYCNARVIIKEEDGSRKENLRAIILLKSIPDRYDVKTEISLFGILEYAKYLAYQAGKQEDYAEKTKFYTQAVKLLKKAKLVEPDFRGVQLYLAKYTKSLDELSKGIEPEPEDQEGSLEDEVLALARDMSKERIVSIVDILEEIEPENQEGEQK